MSLRWAALCAIHVSLLHCLLLLYLRRWSTLLRWGNATQNNTEQSIRTHFRSIRLFVTHTFDCYCLCGFHYVSCPVQEESVSHDMSEIIRSASLSEYIARQRNRNWYWQSLQLFEKNTHKHMTLYLFTATMYADTTWFVFVFQILLTGYDYSFICVWIETSMIAGHYMSSILMTHTHMKYKKMMGLKRNP